MPTYKTNDGVNIIYKTFGKQGNPPLIFLHGFTGSSLVFDRNVSAFDGTFYVVVPDLRGHGDSDKPLAGYHVARLALDLENLFDHLNLQHGSVSAVGTSLGAAILWSYAELFGASTFKQVVFVDQAPLQNHAPDWGPEFANRGCYDSQSLITFQDKLEHEPTAAHIGTVSACLGYRSHPQAGDPTESSLTWQNDEQFFVTEALKGDGRWYGKLMADHTALDWRDSIAQNFGDQSGVATRVLVIASKRSGCFPAAGPFRVVELVNGGTEAGRATGAVVDWGGHWCYWERPDLFNDLVISFLEP